MFTMIPQSFRMSLALLCITILIGSTAVQTLPEGGEKIFYRNISAFAMSNMLLSAPYFYNVSAGGVWVYPSSPTDLGARDMSCECFDPDQTCCMAKDRSMAPFCISKNSTCCADTFCGPNETCCGVACCPSGTTCDTKSGTPGCCPNKQTCTATPICYDYNTTSCTGTFFALPQCCPSDLPYCRNFAPYGMGCFVSSAKSAETSSMFSVPTLITNAAPTVPISRLSNQDTTNAAISTAHSISTILTVTITVRPLSSGHYSIDFPSIPTSNGTSTIYASTTYALSFPPTTSTRAQPTISVFSTGHTASKQTHSSTSSSSTLTPSSSPTTTTSTISALCYNTSLLTNAACPTTTTTTAAEAGYNPPGTSIIHSPGTRLLPPFQRLKAFLSHLTPLQSFLTGIVTTASFNYLAPLSWTPTNPCRSDLKPIFSSLPEIRHALHTLAERVQDLEEQHETAFLQGESWWATWSKWMIFAILFPLALAVSAFYVYEAHKETSLKEKKMEEERTRVSAVEGGGRGSVGFESGNGGVGAGR